MHGGDSERSLVRACLIPDDLRNTIGGAIAAILLRIGLGTERHGGNREKEEATTLRAFPALEVRVRLKDVRRNTEIEGRVGLGGGLG